MHAKQWRVDVFLTEDGDLTKARAVLNADRQRALSAGGSARRNPHDPAVPEIGDEMAVGRALAALSNQLLDRAYLDVDESAGDLFRVD